MANWIRTYEHDGDYVESLDGVEWADAPLPPRRHQCTAQTRGWFGLDYIERCACGAARQSVHHSWLNKNETRINRKRQKREDRLPRVYVNCQVCGEPYEAAKGSHQARDMLCTRCWSDALIERYA